MQKGNQKAVAVVTLLGLSLSVLAAVVSARRITGPLRELKDKLAAFGAGDTGARIDLTRFGGYKTTGDELSVLAASFNKMLDDVNVREAEKGRYLKEIEQKGQAKRFRSMSVHSSTTYCFILSAPESCPDCSHRDLGW